MNKRDYDLIAQILGAARAEYSRRHRSVVDKIIHDFALVLYEENKRFDRVQFMAAIGIEEGAKRRERGEGFQPGDGE